MTLNELMQKLNKLIETNPDTLKYEVLFGDDLYDYDIEINSAYAYSSLKQVIISSAPE